MQPKMQGAVPAVQIVHVILHAVQPDVATTDPAAPVANAAKPTPVARRKPPAANQRKVAIRPAAATATKTSQF